MPELPFPAAQLWLRRLLATAALLAGAVVILGAYVRLKDAGLGCPDWPGCYGQLIGVPASDSAGTPIEQDKAWIEVAHRYLAATLGLLVLAAAGLAWVKPVPRAQRLLVTTLLGLIGVQALLGALTVTRLLQPVIVTAHLLGGLSILAVLAAYAIRAYAIPGFGAATKRSPTVLLLAAAVALLGQVALGGWVSTNYAGLACGTTLPSCNGKWLPPVDSSAFALDRKLSSDSAGAPITQQALATVNYLHRLLAVIVTVLIAALAFALWQSNRKIQAATLLSALSLQLLLGMYIILTALPLVPSLLHNAGAALLCALLAAVAAVPAANR